MRVLGWDTSARQGALFAAEFDDAATSVVQMRAARELSVDQRQHSEGLLLGIDETLEELQWKWSEVDAIAVGVGPGSFTGIRIGLTTARTLGQMLGLPLLPVSSLEAMEWAGRAGSSGWDASLLAVEACMGEIYCRWSSGRSEPFREEVLKLARLREFHDEWLQSGKTVPTQLIAPSSLLKVPAVMQLAAEYGFSMLPFDHWKELPEALAGLAHRAWLRSDVRGALDVQATYLRASDAELKLKERLAAAAALRG